MLAKERLAEVIAAEIARQVGYELVDNLGDADSIYLMVDRPAINVNAIAECIREADRILEAEQAPGAAAGVVTDAGLLCTCGANCDFAKIASSPCRDRVLPVGADAAGEWVHSCSAHRELARGAASDFFCREVA